MEGKKGSRINGIFRWSEITTTQLLTCVVEAVKSNPEQFEKPTAQKFYDKISSTSEILQNIKWDIMRTKMRHLKNTYLSALKWKGQTGAGLMEGGEEKNVQQYVNKICPFYTYLEEIFGQRINIQPPAIYQSSQPVPEESDIDFIIEYNTPSGSSVESAPVSPLQIAPVSPLQSAPVSPGCTSCSASQNSSAQKKGAFKNKNLKRPNNSSPFALLFEIQKKKLDLEEKKFLLEEKKEENQFLINKMQLEKEERIEMEKLRLENERLKNMNAAETLEKID